MYCVLQPHGALSVTMDFKSSLENVSYHFCNSISSNPVILLHKMSDFLMLSSYPAGLNTEPVQSDYYCFLSSHVSKITLLKWGYLCSLGITVILLQVIRSITFQYCNKTQLSLLDSILIQFGVISI